MLVWESAWDTYWHIHSWTYITHTYNWAQSHFNQGNTAHEHLMSGCLQVGSVRSLSCYFPLPSMPNITHMNTNSYFTWQYVYLLSSWLTTDALLWSFTLSYNFLFCSPIFLYPTLSPQACFLASSIFHAIFSAISTSLHNMFGKQQKDRGRGILRLALKPVLVFTFCGVCKLQCSDTPLSTTQDGIQKS